MVIKVLGMKCTKSAQLKRLAADVVWELGLNTTIEEISELNKMLKYPIFNSPCLMVGEEVVCSGDVPSKDELMRLIGAAVGR